MLRKVNVFFVLFLLIISSRLFSQKVDLQKREYDVGGVAAYWLSGDVYVEGNKGEKEGSFLLRAFADSYITPKFAIGAFFNFAPYKQNSLDITAYEFGGAFKGRFILTPDFAIKPGLNMAYRWSSGDIEMDGLGLNLSIEFQKVVDERIIFGEFGFLSQPVGGDEFLDITWAPIIYLGGGLLL